MDFTKYFKSNILNIIFLVVGLLMFISSLLFRAYLITLISIFFISSTIYTVYSGWSKKYKK